MALNHRYAQGRLLASLLLVAIALCGSIAAWIHLRNPPARAPEVSSTPPPATTIAEPLHLPTSLVQTSSTISPDSLPDRPLVLSSLEVIHRDPSIDPDLASWIEAWNRKLSCSEPLTDADRRKLVLILQAGRSQVDTLFLLAKAFQFESNDPQTTACFYDAIGQDIEAQFSAPTTTPLMRLRILTDLVEFVDDYKHVLWNEIDAGRADHAASLFAMYNCLLTYAPSDRPGFEKVRRVQIGMIECQTLLGFPERAVELAQRADTTGFSHSELQQIAWHSALAYFNAGRLEEALHLIEPIAKDPKSKLTFEASVLELRLLIDLRRLDDAQAFLASMKYSFADRFAPSSARSYEQRIRRLRQVM